MDAAAFSASACAHYVNEEYEEALKHYTCAVTLREDCAEYRTFRAATHLKLGHFREALADADAALQIDGSAHMALHWKGVALFYAGEYVAAKAAFAESLRLAPQAKAARALWIRKCDAEMSGSTLPLQGLAQEATRASSTGTTTTPAAPAPVAAPTPTAAAPAPQAKAATSTAAGPGLTISGRKQVRREWYQNPTHVFLTLFAKGVQKEQCTTEFEEREVSVSFPLAGSEGEEYQIHLALFDAVVPSGCKVEVGAMKIELTMEKKTVGKQWGDLEKVTEVAAAADQPQYPTSSKTKRDWSQIDRDIETDMKNEKPEGDEALNKLFRDIYERADEDTRRAMNKSFQTSGGTVLSTNWGEVGKADYEGKDRPTPPEGQEWKDWKDK